MRAALVITTYNNPRSLGLCLKSFSSQTRSDFDIFIADDGSGAETKAKIDSLQPLFGGRIKHRWHPDEGYKKARINNSVFRELGAYDVVVLVDHDVVVHPRFIEDHLTLHEKHGPNFMFMGRRVDLSAALTESLSEENVLDFVQATPPPGLLASWWKGETRNLSRAFRVANPLLQKLFGRGGVKDLLGSNFSISRQLLWDVNGYDEEFSSYWGEDGDLFIRVRNSGAKIIGLKSFALQYHLFHKRLEPKKEHEELYARRLKDLSYKRCKQGIFKD